MLQRGPHRSALAKKAVRQLRQETADKITHKYVLMVKWGDIKTNITTTFKISPVSMIPHKSKPYRCILGLSFALFNKGVKFASVNYKTTKISLPEAMAQLGFVLKHIIHKIAQYLHHGLHIKFTKLDVKDGFWRMAVSDEDAWNFYYVLPSLQTTTNIDYIEIVVPNRLQTGWCDNSPFLCSGSETAGDLMEKVRKIDLPPHEFEHYMMQKIDPLGTTVDNEVLVTLLEVYFDDFIAMRNNTSHAHLLQVSRAMLNGIHAIFPPPEVTSYNGFDPVALSKLEKVEGTWEQIK